MFGRTGAPGTGRGSGVVPACRSRLRRRRTLSSKEVAGWTRHRSVCASEQRRSARFSSSSSASTRSPCRSTSAAGAISTLGIAFAFGLGLALAITALGHVSGGHFNPAVSLGLAVARKFPAKEVIPYWIAQLVGGVRRRARGRGRCTPSLRSTRSTPHPGAGISNGGALAARADRDRPVRDRDLHGRDGRPRALEGRHGAAPDRALHLHGGGRDRPGVRRLVQPRAIARPRALQLATSATSGSTSSGRSSGA